MISSFKRFWAAAPVATTVLALALVVAGVFAARTVVDAVYWNDPALREQGVQPWMTPRYIAHAWDLPRRVVLDALAVPVPPPDGPMDLRELAALRGVPLATVLAEAEAMIATPRPHKDARP